MNIPIQTWPRLQPYGTAHRCILKTLLFLALIFSAHCISPSSHAQNTGDQAELMRLRDNAEEAMSIGDPHGAALNTGKAALMAAFLGRQETRPMLQSQFNSLEALLRAQENVYRAIALFQQSGEHIPASAGVCQTMSLALSHDKRAWEQLPPAPSANSLFQNLPTELEEWKETIEELQTEFGCKLAPEN